MKTLRVTVLSILASAAASAAFAGPGIQYWTARNTPPAEQVPAAVTPANPSKCENMEVTVSRRTTTVECKGAVAETPKCKAMCGGS